MMTTIDEIISNIKVKWLILLLDEAFENFKDSNHIKMFELIYSNKVNNKPRRIELTYTSFYGLYYVQYGNDLSENKVDIEFYRIQSKNRRHKHDRYTRHCNSRKRNPVYYIGYDCPYNTIEDDNFKEKHKKWKMIKNECKKRKQENQTWDKRKRIKIQ